MEVRNSRYTGRFAVTGEWWPTEVLSSVATLSIFYAMADLAGIGWRCALHRGKRALQRHDNELALKYLERALSTCPVRSKKELCEILYFLGSTLNKLGMRNCALKSWATAGRLEKNGFAARSIRRYSNGYGMAKQPTVEADDWKAFYSVQLYRYLGMKKSRRLGTDAERDMIEDLIGDAWKELRFSYRFERLGSDEKMRLFRNVKLVFPAFHAPGEDSGDERTIPVDFARKQRITADDHCFCGSGLPYKLCCGRIPGKEELLSGII